MSADLGRPPGFLGTGWSFPPEFGLGGGQIAMASGVADIQQSLAILLATRRSERPMQEGFGCALEEFLFGAMDHGLINDISSRIHDAILYHESRIELIDVEVAPDPVLDGMLRIRLDYRVPETNTRYNMVFPFYLNEATAAGL